MITTNDYLRVRQKVIIELILALSVCLSPFMILFHLLFDELSNTFRLFGTEFSHNYADNQSFIWHILNYSIPTFLLVIIFYTSNIKWRRYIAPLIVLYIISIIHAIFPSLSFNEFLLQTEIILLVLILLEVLMTTHFGFSDLKIDTKFDISGSEIISELLTKSQRKMNKEIEEIISSKKTLSRFHYTCKLYHLHTSIKEHSRKKSFDFRINSSQTRMNKSTLKILLVTLTLVFLIAGLLPSLHKLNILGVEIGNYGFPSAGTFLWYLLQKVVILGVLAIWYLSSNAWWKWAIFTPIIFYSYQILDIFFGGVQIEETQNLITSPIVLIIITLVFFIAALLHKRNKLQKYYLLIQEELQKGILDLSELERV